MKLTKRPTYRLMLVLLIASAILAVTNKAEAASSDGFTITAAVLMVPPAVTALDPLEGSSLAVTGITITGTGYFGSIFSSTVTGVQFDDGVNTVLTGVTVVSDTEIRAFVPAGIIPGNYNVLVTAEGGTNLTSAVTFTVQTGYINTITVNVLKANAYDIIIQPITTNMDVAIPIDSFSSDLFFTFATKANLPPSDRATVKLSALGISMTTNPALQPVGKLTVTIRYRDQDILGLTESKLAIARYDPASGRWLVLRSTVFPAENKVTAIINHVSIYAIIQNAPAADLNEIRVYPNPWNPGTVPQGVVIDGLTSNAVITIYTVSGEKVAELNETNGDGRLIWDGKNFEGVNAASGVYIAVIKNDRELKRVKIGLERQ